MNTETGEIITPDVFEKLKEEQPFKAKSFVEIPHEFKDELVGMNRKDRRNFYKVNKKAWSKKLRNNRGAR